MWIHVLARAFTFIRAQGGNKPSTVKEEFNWRDAIADALIVAGMQFFYTLAGISVAQIVTSPVHAFLAAFISAGLGFFTVLAIKRGLASPKSS